MEDTKSDHKEQDVKEGAQQTPNMPKKNKFATVIHFPHMEHTIVLDIVRDIKAKKPRRQMSREYDVSCYYIIKILKHFKDCQEVSDVEKIYDDIYTTNHIIKPIDHAKNYHNNKAYYKQYSAMRYKREKQQKLDDIEAMHQAEQDILCA